MGNEAGNSEDEKVVMDTQTLGENGLSDRSWKLKLCCTGRLKMHFFWTLTHSNEM